MATAMVRLQHCVTLLSTLIRQSGLSPAMPYNRGLNNEYMSTLERCTFFPYRRISVKHKAATKVSPAYSCHSCKDWKTAENKLGCRYPSGHVLNIGCLNSSLRHLNDFHFPLL